MAKYLNKLLRVKIVAFKFVLYIMVYALQNLEKTYNII